MFEIASISHPLSLRLIVIRSEGGTYVLRFHLALRCLVATHGHGKLTRGCWNAGGSDDAEILSTAPFGNFAVLQ